MNHENYMRLALELAEKGCGAVHPNPMVGAVLVKNGRVIGEGYHHKYDQPHAEREAFADCKEDPEGATLYVTLEPCCHHGKTPPCTDIIIQKKIRHVVIGCTDPNPLVSGQGIEILRKHGIEITVGILEQECLKLNEVFFHFIRYRKPFVVMKYAMSMDGKIACSSGESKWISGKESRQNVHYDRKKYTAVMSGIGTVIQDNPMLNCRIDDPKNPVRIICDSSLMLPLQSNIVATAKEIPTILATCCLKEEKYSPYLDKGIEILCTPPLRGRVDLPYLMNALAEKGIDSILLEGGPTLNWSMLQNKLVQKIQTYIAPKIFGGQSAKSPVGGIGVYHPNQAFMLSEPEIKHFGKDLLLESEVLYCLPES